MSATCTVQSTRTIANVSAISSWVTNGYAEVNSSNGVNTNKLPTPEQTKIIPQVSDENTVAELPQPMFTYDPQILLTLSVLRMELAQLRRENIQLASRNQQLESRMRTGEIAKIFAKLASMSVYRRYFTGIYRQSIIAELTTRYFIADMHNGTNVHSDIDMRVLKHNFNRIGAECAAGHLRTHAGEDLYFDGG